jgi:TolA-binding protein
MRTRSNLAMVVVLALSMTGCLKTRAQLREDAEDGSRPAAPIQEVKPQGQYVVDELKSEITRLEGRVEDLE